MVLARRGPKGKVDTFLGFWLAILADGRQARFETNRKRTRQTIDRFLDGAAVKDAREILGEDVLAAELEDAAVLYFQTCMTDSRYATTLFGTKHMERTQVVAKAAAEAAGAVGVMVESGATGFAARLPALLVGGFMSALGADAAPVIRAALMRIPSARHLEGLAGTP